MMNQNETVHWFKLVFDICSVLMLFLSFHVIKLFLKPFKSSFNCNDYTVNMPFRPSTVTNFHLILLSLILPLMTIIATEIFKTIFTRNPRHKKKSIIIYKVKFLHEKILQFPEQIGNLYISCGSFFFGLLSTAVITDFGKVVVGRLRPNFIDVCKPDLNPYTHLCKLNKTFLIPEVDFKCTAENKESVEESRLSFPSGHSSLSFYSMIFLILFVNHTWKCRNFGLLPRMVQISFFMMAFFTALSRIADNKHHPTDVLAGATLGTITSICSFICMTNYLKKTTAKTRYSTLSCHQYDQENVQEAHKDINENDHKYTTSFNI
ncbi:phosphatidate phosphatase isoform X1 [Brachionus plicatilis]|uniref:Phosphatidate phosphatase isoform X1 n=1 Tax=Brachionus plicatilis TaxID=10195 RepID=A0A3M7QZX7_BRAPC|nr:phosphatidate phosphatase isoform X1 [Brachionus plicatilis]